MALSQRFIEWRIKKAIDRGDMGALQRWLFVAKQSGDGAERLRLQLVHYPIPLTAEEIAALPQDDALKEDEEPTRSGSLIEYAIATSEAATKAYRQSHKIKDLIRAQETFQFVYLVKHHLTGKLSPAEQQHLLPEAGSSDLFWYQRWLLAFSQRYEVQWETFSVDNFRQGVEALQNRFSFSGQHVFQNATEIPPWWYRLFLWLESGWQRLWGQAKRVLRRSQHHEGQRHFNQFSAKETLQSLLNVRPDEPQFPDIAGTSGETQQNTLPEHMRHWVRERVLQHELDHEREIEQAVDTEQSLAAVESLKLLNDHSTTQAFDSVVAKQFQPDYSISISTSDIHGSHVYAGMGSRNPLRAWLFFLEDELYNEYEGQEEEVRNYNNRQSTTYVSLSKQGFQFSLSDDALRILTLYGRHIPNNWLRDIEVLYTPSHWHGEAWYDAKPRNIRRALRDGLGRGGSIPEMQSKSILPALPMGFYIDAPSDSGERTLCFSDELRLAQKQDVRHQSRLDLIAMGEPKEALSTLMVLKDRGEVHSVKELFRIDHIGNEGDQMAVDLIETIPQAKKEEILSIYQSTSPNMCVFEIGVDGGVHIRQPFKPYALIEEGQVLSEMGERLAEQYSGWLANIAVARINLIDYSKCVTYLGSGNSHPHPHILDLNVQQALYRLLSDCAQRKPALLEPLLAALQKLSSRDFFYDYHAIDQQIDASCDSNKRMPEAHFQRNLLDVVALFYLFNATASDIDLTVIEFMNSLADPAQYSDAELSFFFALSSRPVNAHLADLRTEERDSEQVAAVEAESQICLQDCAKTFPILMASFRQEARELPDPEVFRKSGFTISTHRCARLFYHESSVKRYMSLDNGSAVPADIVDKPSTAPSEVKEVTSDGRRRDYNITASEGAVEEEAAEYPVTHFEEVIAAICAQTPLFPGDGAYLKESLEQLNQLDLQHDEHLELNELKKSDKSDLKLLTYIRRALRPKYEVRLEQTMAILLLLRGDHSLLNIETDEGKTLIVHVTALIHALQGRKVDVLTHAESFAKRDCTKASRELAGRFGLTVVSRYDNNWKKHWLTADIFYNDIAQSIQDAMAHRDKDETRRADVAIVDEVDNITLDVDSTTTIQMAAPVKSDMSNQCLVAIYKETLALFEDPSCDDPQVQLSRVREAVGTGLLGDMSDADLADWVGAAVSASQLQRDEHYVVTPMSDETSRIEIMHKDTSGRRDEDSHWGHGIHQMVAVREWQANDSIQVPRVSKSVAEASVENHLRQYKICHGLTGSLGSPESIAVMKRMMSGGEQDTVCHAALPRAKRLLEKPEDPFAREETPELKWPQLSGQSPMDSNQDVERSTVYRRRYDFAPEVVAGDTDAHNARLLEAIRGAQAKGFSTLVFFKTVAECEAFQQFLLVNHVTDIQIFDDVKTSEQRIRPTERMMLGAASVPGQVTLTTAAGGRAVNFKGIDIGIVAKPMRERELTQCLGRCGRGASLASTYQIYSQQDLPNFPRLDVQPEVEAPAPEVCQIKSFKSGFFAPLQEGMEQASLAKIEASRDKRAFKARVQAEYQARRAAASDSGSLDAAWPGFFSQIDTLWQEGQPARAQEKVQACWQEQFTTVAGWNELAACQLVVAPT